MPADALMASEARAPTASSCFPVVHQLAPSVRPERWRHAMDSWSPFLRTLHGDDDLPRIINATVPEHTEAVLHFRSKIERVDLARYALMYRDGGIYADADQQLISEARMREAACSNTAVIPTEVVFEVVNGRRRMRRVVGQSLLISPARHPFWLALIHFLVARYDPRCYEPLNTGPDALTAFVNSLCAAASSTSTRPAAQTERTRARLLLHNVSFEDGFGAGYITRHLATGHWRTSASIEHRERHIRHCPNDYAALSREGTCARLTRRTYLHGLPPSPPWRDWSANGGEGMASVLAFWASSLAWCLAGVVAYGALGGLGMLCRSLAERWSERAST